MSENKTDERNAENPAIPHERIVSCISVCYYCGLPPKIKTDERGYTIVCEICEKIEQPGATRAITWPWKNLEDAIDDWECGTKFELIS